MTAALTLTNVVGRTALGPLGEDRPLNLVVNAGEAFVVIGGKETSSLFRLIMGLGTLSAGEIVCGDLRLTPGTASEDVLAFRQRIGFAFRDKGLISNLSLLDNVDLPAKYHGRYAKGVAAGSLAKAALAELGVDESHWTLRPNRITWETRKKVLLARAVVLAPPLLILDDPSTMAASPMVLDIMRWIRARQARGTALLIGTNDYPFGLAIADWILHPKTREPVRRYDDFVDPTWIKSAALLAESIAPSVTRTDR
jgi:ABC-type transporter Mla maintaining outer membrane lipid asymmetry ATPase subunit MlaF